MTVARIESGRDYVIEGEGLSLDRKGKCECETIIWKSENVSYCLLQVLNYLG